MEGGSSLSESAWKEHLGILTEKHCTDGLIFSSSFSAMTEYNIGYIFNVQYYIVRLHVQVQNNTDIIKSINNN